MTPAGLIISLVLIVLSVLAPAVSGSLRADTGEAYPGVTVSLKPDTVLVGDRVFLSVRVSHRESETVAIEGIDSVSVNPSVLIGRKESSSKPLPGAGSERFDYELAVFGSGRQAVPPFTVVLRDGAGAVTKRVPFRSANSVYIKALTDSTMHDLRPIRPPQRPSMPLSVLFPFLLSVFGVALLVLLLLFILKRSVRKSAERVDPGQVAQRKLRKLGSRLSGGMPPHECYEELSNIMRAYLENHYRIRALEAVTQEIERDLKKLGVSGLENIMNLLRQADLVKFADSRPDLDESRQSLQKAEEVVRTSHLEKREQMQ
ncbi:MAG: hypothetical protein FDX30_01465 [Chlorobium sp.]|nr:MAG: hypothetical protein FDX30_01465 [Chlorobium sp.]